MYVSDDIYGTCIQLTRFWSGYDAQLTSDVHNCAPLARMPRKRILLQHMGQYRPGNQPGALIIDVVDAIEQVGRNLMRS